MFGTPAVMIEAPDTLLAEFGVTLILQGISDLLGEADEFVELTNGNESAIAGVGFVRNFDDSWFVGQKDKDKWESRL